MMTHLLEREIAVDVPSWGNEITIGTRGSRKSMGDWAKEISNGSIVIELEMREQREITKKMEIVPEE